MGGRNHKAKLTSRSSPATHSDKGVSALKGKGASCCYHSAQEPSLALQDVATGYKHTAYCASTLTTLLDSHRYADRGKKFGRA